MNKYFEIKAKDEEAEILLYGDIGESWFAEGNGSKEFVEELKAVKNAKQLSIRINSGGGSVFEGLAIYNAIDRHSAKKTVYIDGLAASIASVIAMAGESIVMAENGMFMIHNPFGGVLGNASEMRKMADALDKIKEGMILSYQRKSKSSRDELSKLMNEETWMTAKEAKAAGFVTEIGKGMKMAASIKIDSSHYKKLPSLLVSQAEIQEGDTNVNPPAQFIPTYQPNPTVFILKPKDGETETSIVSPNPETFIDPVRWSQIQHKIRR